MATRLEKVVLDIDSNLAPVMIRDAQAAALLKRELNSLSGTAVRGTTRDFDAIGNSAERGGKQIDRFSGRIRLLGQALAILGPASVPVGALAIPAVAGLAAQLGAAALAGGTAVIAFQGVGDALKAVNKAALEPTTANLEEARIAMQAIGPEAQAFVTELRAMAPALQGVRNAAAAGLFPGLTESLGDLETMLPRVEGIVFSLGEALGGLIAGGAESLAGPRWADFLTFIETEVPSALTELGHTIGNLTHGLAEMWMAFTPLNQDFSQWMLDASASFDQWAQGLAQTDGFQEFIDYIRTNGPVVADALGSIGNAVLQIVEAAAPLGGPVLVALGKTADAIAAIADSDLGTPIMAAVTAMSALRLATAAANTQMGALITSQLVARNGFGQLGVKMGGLAKSAAVLGGLTIASTEMGDSFELSNTAAGALIGTMGGPWGVALGAAAGFALDFAAAGDAMEAALLRVQTAFEGTDAGEQREAIKGLEMAADGASRGFLDLGDVFGLVSNPIAAAKSSFALLSGETGRAREQIEFFKKKVKGDTGLPGLMGALDGTTGSFRRATGSAQTFRNAVAQVNAVLSKRASFRDYEAALDDFADALDNVKNKARLLTKAGKINITIPKGREIQAQLDNIAATALKVAENLRGADRVKFLARARKDFVEVATLLLGDKDAARALATELGLLDKKRARPKVELQGAPAATSAAHDVAAAIAAIKSKTVFVNVHTRRTTEGGGTGYGPDFYDGGFTGPGRKDEPAGVVHRGEVVIPQEDVKRDWAMLKARYGHLPGMATGGLAGAKMSQFSGSAELARLAEAAQDVVYGFEQVTFASANSLKAQEKELTVRQRLLEKELERDRARLDMLRQEREAIASAVSSAFHVDPFAAAGGLDLPEWMSADTAALIQNQQQISALESGIAEKKEAIRLLKILRKRGLNGPAFINLAATGDVETLRAFVDMSKAELRQYERLTNRDLALEQKIGAFAGNAEMGKDIRAQLREVRESKTELKQVNQRLHRVEKLLEKAPKDTGKAVGDEINDAGGSAARRR